MCNKRAFSLVETLVVIGIIAMLIALLMPAVNRAREQANKVVCQMNMRGMGQALVMYMNENKYFPGHCVFLPGREIVAVWPTRLRKTMKGGRQMFNCPSQPNEYRWRDNYGAGPGFAIASDTGYGYEIGEMLLNVFTVPSHYAYNDWGYYWPTTSNEEQQGLGGDICGGYDCKELRAKRVKKPAEMIAIADRTAAGNWNFNLGPYQGGELPGITHSGGCNVLFCDGHVEWFLQWQICDIGRATNQLSDSQFRIMQAMWNNDNLPNH